MRRQLRARRSNDGLGMGADRSLAGARHAVGVRKLAGCFAVGLMVVGSTTTSFAQQPSASLAGTTIDVLAVQGEDGRRETGDWQVATGAAVKTSTFRSDLFDPAFWDQAFDALTQGTYDVVTVGNQYVRPWAATGVLMPLDICRLSNWSRLFPVLQDADFIRDDAGNVLAVPIIWGDAPFIYAPDRVSEPPSSIKDLLGSKWRGRLTAYEDPIPLLHMLAVARGYPSPRLSQKQLGKVKADVGKLLRNMARMGTYDDMVNMLVTGDADLIIGGSEDMLDAAAASGTRLAYGFFDESHGGGWSHAMSIPANAVDVDAAYAYIDAVINAQANAALATNVFAGTADRDSVPLLTDDAPPFDYSLVDADVSLVDPTSSAAPASCPDVEAGASAPPAASQGPVASDLSEHANVRPLRFENWNPPARKEGKVVSIEEWFTAWQEAIGS